MAQDLLLSPEAQNRSIVSKEKECAEAPDFIAWRPPAPSCASRRPAKNSRGSGRASIVIGSSPHVIHCESFLEQKVAYVLLAMSEIVDIYEQPPAVHYLDAAGKWRAHTFDFLAKRRDGTKIAVVVKPRKRAEKLDLQGFVLLIAPQIPKSFADGVLLMDETDCDPDTLHDAMLIHAMRRHNDLEADQIVEDIVATLNGSVVIRALVETSGLGPRAFGAIVRQIGNRVLTTVNARRISHDIRVRRNDGGFNGGPQ